MVEVVHQQLLLKGLHKISKKRMTPESFSFQFLTLSNLGILTVVEFLFYHCMYVITQVCRVYALMIDQIKRDQRSRGLPHIAYITQRVSLLALCFTL